MNKKRGVSPNSRYNHFTNGTKPTETRRNAEADPEEVRTQILHKTKGHSRKTGKHQEQGPISQGARTHTRAKGRVEEQKKLNRQEVKFAIFVGTARGHNIVEKLQR